MEMQKATISILVAIYIATLFALFLIGGLLVTFFGAVSYGYYLFVMSTKTSMSISKKILLATAWGLLCVVVSVFAGTIPAYIAVIGFTRFYITWQH
ncbi:hypothetical protein C5B42_00635 [Candidatus Cerribacteria bacterium 'Amazon FNV 2010 28 9']|uniref:Uncharacterized protein n=1 Tax=Candidatus Cerribacteria bacterium 'Amazon FNV 2010 28 9' TaxID=2081795 RepID=A0A317JPV6_9BACT|nr:MAG: hypothetical protein C5B42_00635 [Candidatus Cerribacteria bacterium 'Amazon FNV 2010 28 9']